MSECQFHGFTVRPDGIHELEPCLYEEVERYENVTVVISKCVHCGKIDISWVRQDNTRKV